MYVAVANPFKTTALSMTMIRSALGLTASEDQQIGGLLMWVPACLIYLGAILALLGRLYRGEREDRA